MHFLRTKTSIFSNMINEIRPNFGPWKPGRYQRDNLKIKLVIETWHTAALRCSVNKQRSNLQQREDFLNWWLHHIPINFFWDISVRFLSWECWDFWRRHDHFRRFPKKSEVFRRRPKSTEGRVRVRDREESIVIYSFCMWFLFLAWVWVNIFLETVSSKTATTHLSIRREKLACRRE